MADLPVTRRQDPQAPTGLSIARQLSRRYYLSMLSLALVVLVLASISMSISGHMAHFRDLALGVVLVLVVLNFAGALLIFAPIARFLEGRGTFEAALPRIHRLAVASGVWAFLVVSLHMYVQFLLHHVWHVRLAPDLLELVVFPSVLIAVFGIYMGVFAYFLVGDYVSRLKEEIFREFRVVIEPRRGRLLFKLTVAFLAVAVLPLSLILLRMLVFSDLPHLQGLATSQVIQNDVLAAMFLTAVAVVFITRSLTRPVTSLLAVMGRISGGELTSRAPVISDDEVGRLSLGFNEMAEQLEEQAFVRKTFGKFVPASVMEAVLRDRGSMRPQLREATILFTDIEGFAAICERLRPEQVVTMLNEYFTAAAKPINDLGGVITQFQGDAMLVSFNLPVEDPNHAGNAVRAALGIQAIMRTLRFADGIPLNTRIGINTGAVVGGLVGDGDRLDYTVHGDAVNLAARLEQLNKEHGTRILISQRTADLAGQGFSLREVGRVPIRGHKESVQVYEVSDA